MGKNMTLWICRQTRQIPISQHKKQAREWIKRRPWLPQSPLNPPQPASSLSSTTILIIFDALSQSLSHSRPPSAAAAHSSAPPPSPRPGRSRKSPTRSARKSPNLTPWALATSRLWRAPATPLIWTLMWMGRHRRRRRRSRGLWGTTRRRCPNRLLGLWLMITAGFSWLPISELPPLSVPPLPFLLFIFMLMLSFRFKILIRLQVDPTNNFPLECVIRRVFRSSRGDECMLLCPVDT